MQPECAVELSLLDVRDFGSESQEAGKRVYLLEAVQYQCIVTSAMSQASKLPIVTKRGGS